MKGESCSIDGKGNSCCNPKIQNKHIDYKQHWDNTYLNSKEDNLGWYEKDLSATKELILKADLDKSARILNVGAGNTTLIEVLLKMEFTNLIATDLSEVALNKLNSRLKSDKISFIVDDLTNPTLLNDIQPVDIWIDRAVLHFFTKTKEQDTYFNLLKNKVKNKGFVLLAQYNLSGAKICAGLPINRYNKAKLVEKLGEEFELIQYFDYTYIMPSGDERPYIYTLFRKK